MLNELKPFNYNRKKNKLQQKTLRICCNDSRLFDNLFKKIESSKSSKTIFSTKDIKSNINKNLKLRYISPSPKRKEVSKVEPCMTTKEPCATNSPYVYNPENVIIEEHTEPSEQKSEDHGPILSSSTNHTISINKALNTISPVSKENEKIILVPNYKRPPTSKGRKRNKTPTRIEKQIWQNGGIDTPKSVSNSTLYYITQNKTSISKNTNDITNETSQGKSRDIPNIKMETLKSKKDTPEKIFDKKFEKTPQKSTEKTPRKNPLDQSKIIPVVKIVPKTKSSKKSRDRNQYFTDRNNRLMREKIQMEFLTSLSQEHCKTREGISREKEAADKNYELNINTMKNWLNQIQKNGFDKKELEIKQKQLLHSKLKKSITLMKAEVNSASRSYKNIFSFKKGKIHAENEQNKSIIERNKKEAIEYKKEIESLKKETPGIGPETETIKEETKAIKELTAVEVGTINHMKEEIQRLNKANSDIQKEKEVLFGKLKLIKKQIESLRGKINFQFKENANLMLNVDDFLVRENLFSK